MKASDIVYPWKRASSVYQDDGPSDDILFDAGPARFFVAPTAHRGWTTGRRGYHVVCTTCDILIHTATTGPASLIESHLVSHHRVER